MTQLKHTRWVTYTPTPGRCGSPPAAGIGSPRRRTRRRPRTHPRHHRAADCQADHQRGERGDPAGRTAARHPSRRHAVAESPRRGRGGDHRPNSGNDAAAFRRRPGVGGAAPAPTGSGDVEPAPAATRAGGRAGRPNCGDVPERSAASRDAAWMARDASCLPGFSTTAIPRATVLRGTVAVRRAAPHPGPPRRTGLPPIAIHIDSRRWH